MKSSPLGVAAAGLIVLGVYLVHAQQAPPAIPAALQWAYGYGASAPVPGAVAPQAQPAPPVNNDELSPEDIRDVAAYVAAQPPPPGPGGRQSGAR